MRAAPLPPPAPLPSNGLPAQLDLKNALRADLALSGPEWIVTSGLAATPKPAFRAKPGRVVVLAVTNRADKPTVFRLHGHHFRLLERIALETWRQPRSRVRRVANGIPLVATVAMVVWGHNVFAAMPSFFSSSARP